MELKTARLTLLIGPNKKNAFERLCASQDRTASQVVRQLIREYLVQHGVQLGADGAVMGAPQSGRRAAGTRAESTRAARPVPAHKRRPASRMS